MKIHHTIDWDTYRTPEPNLSQIDFSILYHPIQEIPKNMEGLCYEAQKSVESLYFSLPQNRSQNTFNEYPKRIKQIIDYALKKDRGRKTKNI
jgi:hypothetical protein